MCVYVHCLIKSYDSIALLVPFCIITPIAYKLLFDGSLNCCCCCFYYLYINSLKTYLKHSFWMLSGYGDCAFGAFAAAWWSLL